MVMVMVTVTVLVMAMAIVVLVARSAIARRVRVVVKILTGIMVTVMVTSMGGVHPQGQHRPTRLQWSFVGMTVFIEVVFHAARLPMASF